MSKFGVTIERISSIKPADNADSLDLAGLEGKEFQFVIRKNEYKIGDVVIYFPVDSLIPEDVLEMIGLTGKLSGSGKNRVKTIRLRGNLSQGIVTPLALFLDRFPASVSQFGDDVSTYLGVEKYEIPEVAGDLTRDGSRIHFPPLLTIYDIEGAQNFPNVVDLLMDQLVTVSEKLEGTNWWGGLWMNDDGFLDVHVGSRRFELVVNRDEGKSEDVWNKAYTEQFAEKMSSIYEYVRSRFNNDEKPFNVVLRGELIGSGIQGNYYDFPANERKVYLFDIELNGRPLNAKQFMNVCNAFGLPMVPYIKAPTAQNTLREYLNGRTVQEASTFNFRPFTNSTTQKEKLAEGIVIKPLIEQWHEQIGRLFIKQRSPEYLIQTGA